MKKEVLIFKGAAISFEHRGDGRPVIFLHGFLESKKMWGSISNKLAAHFNPVCIDLPGHGASENLGYAHRMELFAEIVYEVLKKLRRRKAVVVGHSMGGYAALAFADLYPDMLNGLVLINSSARADSKQKKLNRTRGIALCRENHLTFIRQSLPLLFREADREKYRTQIKHLIQEASRMSAQGIIAALEGMKVRNSREILLKFPPYPVLFVAGKEDPVLSWEDIEPQTKRSERIKSLIFDEGGHMSFIENEAVLYKNLRAFLYQCLP